jgi:hypothetical protein
MEEENRKKAQKAYHLGRRFFIHETPPPGKITTLMG